MNKIRVRIALVLKTELNHEEVARLLEQMPFVFFADWCTRRGGERREWLVEDLTNQKEETL